MGRGRLGVTVAVCAIAFLAAALRYEGFASLAVVRNFLTDHAFLGFAAVGMTFAILSGGIDLSVGSMVGLSSILVALAIRAGVPPLVAFAGAALGGALFGALQGTWIARFELPPFLVTLAGMFLLRGAAQTLSLESVGIRHGFYRQLEELGTALLPVPALALSVLFLAAAYCQRHTRFGRNVLAVGGGLEAARRLGVPVGRTLVQGYAVSGAVAALGGVVYTLYTSSGNASAGRMLELDAIAVVVMGGTLLRGGVGGVAGTFFGLLIFAILQAAITFEGTLSSWWSQIASGGLLLAFVVLQSVSSRVLGRRAA